ncbi:MAG: glutathionylspermidine synthase family protein [Eubacterium sp.]|nr:glutathionylspermidine synthase family protein [Eubacterium sp.]
MKSIYEEYIQEIAANPDVNAAAAQEIRKYLTEHGIVYHGNTVRTLGIPNIYTEEETALFDQIVSTTYGIFEKIIAAYLEDPAYRRLFPFSKELEELILTPRGYDSFLPVTRMDIFYNDDTKDFKFCEINTDGTSAMNEDRVMNEALARLNPAHRKMLEKYEFSTYELMDSWVKTFLEIYGTYDRRVPHPHVAICDYLATVEIEEFREFARRFEKAGVTCEVCEITELTYRDHALYSPSGKQIHAIYRRVVTTDVMENYDDLTPFLDAVRSRDVCIIGAFCTQIVHNKWLFKMLHEAPTRALLTDEECAFIDAHIPFTGILDHSLCDFDAIRADKDRWILKPMDSYGSQGVYDGRDCTDEEWAAHLEACDGQEYIYQEFCPPYRSTNIDFIEKNPAFAEYANMAGLYVYNGKFAGIYSRRSAGNIISSQYNERDNASVVLRGTK